MNLSGFTYTYIFYFTYIALWTKQQENSTSKKKQQKKSKEILCSTSVFISDQDMDKLYLQFFRPKQPQIETLVQEWVDLYQRFWSRLKTSQSCIIRFKKYRLRLEFLNLIIHSCSFFLNST